MIPPPISALCDIQIPLSGSASSNSRKGSIASIDDLFGDDAKENIPSFTTDIEEEESSKVGVGSDSVSSHLLTSLSTGTLDVNANNTVVISRRARGDALNGHTSLPQSQFNGAHSHGNTTPGPLTVSDSSKTDFPSPISAAIVSSVPVEESVSKPRSYVISNMKGGLGDAVHQNQTVAPYPRSTHIFTAPLTPSPIAPSPTLDPMPAPAHQYLTSSGVSGLPVFTTQARLRALACMSQSVHFYGLGSIQAQPSQVQPYYTHPCPVFNEPQEYYGPSPNMPRIHHHLPGSCDTQNQNSHSYLLPPSFAEPLCPAPPTPFYSETSTDSDSIPIGSRSRSRLVPGRPLVIVPQTGTDADRRKNKHRKRPSQDSVPDSDNLGSKPKKAKKGNQ